MKKNLQQMNSRKIVIGTANFGMKYGLNNKNITSREIKKISVIVKKKELRLWIQHLGMKMYLKI